MSSSASPDPVAGRGEPGVRIWETLARPWWQRITFRLILLVLAVSIFPPLTLGVLAMRSARVAQESEVRERSAAVASWGVDKVQSYLANIEEDLRLIVELGDLQTMNPVAAKPLLSFFLSFSEDVKEISLLDASGRERLKVAESILVVPGDLGSQAGTAKVQVPLSGETYIGQVRTSEFSEPFLTLAVPIRKLAEDQIVGVLAVEVNLKRLWDEVLSFKVGQSGYVYLVNGKGQLLAHPDFSLVLARRDLSGAGAVQRFLKGEDEPAPGTSLEYPNYQGVQVIGLHARSRKLGWGVIVEQPTAEAFASVNRMKIETTIILINAVAVTLVLAIISARTLTRPLAELAQGARLLGAGDFDHRFPVRSRDEIAEVAERFNAMADQLQEAFQRLRTLLETSTMTSSSLELEKVLTTALEQMDHLAGRAQSGIVLAEGSLTTHPPVSVTVRTLGMPEGARPLDLNPHDFPNLWQLLSTGKTFAVDDIATLAGSGRQALWTPQGLGAVVLLPLLSKGESLGALWMGRTSPGPFGADEVALGQTMANHVAIAIDNARLYDALRRTSEELEFRVEARTRELREAHEELVRRERLALVGQLAGGVGHELRNPLGAIGNAVYYLRMRLGGGDDMKVQKHLAILETEVRRANKIVTDLLDFSRVKQPSRAPAQLNAIIRDILARQPQPSSVKLELDLIGSLPPILVDPDQVGQVVLNLVINAIEAMPDGGTLTIRTWSTSDAVVASVSDTGVGIPPENLEKIFQPLFTTKTKGIGLGLAVSRQLIDANGGALSVESQIGKGSTFTAIFPIEGSESVNHG